MSLAKPHSIRVTGLSPLPAGVKADSPLACSRCHAGFEPQLELGVFVIALKREYLPLCDACADKLAEDATLLIMADCGDEQALKERMRQVLLLRGGRVTHFEQ